MITKIAEVSLRTRLDNNFGNLGRRSPTQKVTYMIDAPRIDNRGCQPLQIQPQGYSLMTTKVVIMLQGYHLYSKKYNSLTYHTSQGWQEDLTCQNGKSF
jgi:hypothetical protein